MAIRTVLGLAFTAVLFVAGTEGCTLGSDTYISETSAESTRKDAGSSTATTTSASTATSATCGTDDWATVDLTKQTACGNGKGHCYDKTKMAGAANLDVCPDASQVCVPDEILKAAGQKLKTCNTILSTPGACIAIDAISQIASQGGSALGQDACDAGQKCVPCANPQNNNAPTGFCDAVGVHEKACTAGAAAATGTTAAAAPGCCTTNGKSNGVCIASTAVPESQRDQAPTDTCAGDNKCVPSAFVAGTPTTCNAGILGNGVCMDKCFNNMMSIAGGFGLLSKATCGATELCIPCIAVSGQGVPGCQ